MTPICSDHVTLLRRRATNSLLPGPSPLAAGEMTPVVVGIVVVEKGLGEEPEKRLGAPVCLIIVSALKYL